MIKRLIAAGLILAALTACGGDTNAKQRMMDECSRSGGYPVLDNATNGVLCSKSRPCGYAGPTWSGEAINDAGMV